jgi:predicted ester cyclase
MSLTSAQVESTVLPFYREALTVNDQTTPAEVLSRILSPEFQSLSAQGSKTRDMLIGQLAGFWRLIPDLRWEPQEVLVCGDKVTVRSVATGTPKGNFFGVETDGSRAFRIDTIDIHEVVDGVVTRVHHVEDWAAAFRQVRG